MRSDRYEARENRFKKFTKVWAAIYFLVTAAFLGVLAYANLLPFDILWKVAAVVSAEGTQLLSMVQGSDGAGGMALKCDNRPVRNLYRQGALAQYAFTEMNGSEVYKFAVRTVPKAINEALEKAKITADDVSLYLLHQANLRIIESVAKRLHQPMDKFPTNLEECGNISAASVPILLDKVRKDGMIGKGDKIVLAGFGAGLTWGACVIEW